MEENNNMNLNVEERNNRNTIYIVIIIILSLLLLGLSYYTFFVRGNNKIEDENNNVSQETINSGLTITKVTDSVVTDTQSYAISGELLGRIFLVANEGAVYLTDVKVESDSVGNKIGTKATYEYNDKYHPYPENITKYEGYKLNISNVVSAYFYENGNAGISYDIVLIDKEHNASILSLTGDYHKNVITDAVYYKNIKKNIVSVSDTLSGNGAKYNLIDINGDRYSIS